MKFRITFLFTLIGFILLMSQGNSKAQPIEDDGIINDDRADSLPSGNSIEQLTFELAPELIWQNQNETQLLFSGIRHIIPQKYRTVTLNYDALNQLLDAAPLQRTAEAEKKAVILSLPLPNGEFARFRIVQAPIMSPELAAKLPNVHTYAGQGVDNPLLSVRFDTTPTGFHGMIMGPDESVYIDPYSVGNKINHIVYNKADYQEKGTFNFREPIIYDQIAADALAERVAADLFIPAGAELRRYRAAIGATGEYTQFHGGTVPLAQAAIVTTMNRVTGIYERELSITFVLVDNSGVVYANGATDPYDNANAGTLINQSQTQMDGTIGAANYDIGHVFSTGAGGLAGLGVVCTNNQKARGVTGTGAPIGDPYDIDYVAHEIGHQFGGNHTFNGDAGSCAGGNRNAGTAYEPGSGTTIQAYAGICAPQNTQSNSDDHFHTGSFDEMMSYSTAGGGGYGCAVKIATGNSAPVPNAGTGGYTIPINTPFELTGSATDPDGDPMLYRWEQFDLGAAGHPNTPAGNAPIFRSFSAANSPTRTFPQLSDLLNNTQTIGEILPSYSRNLNFRMTVLDYVSLNGGVDYDTISFSADAGAGPFLVTYPNTVVGWTTGGSETVTWNVANTTAAPVSCANVDILLSYDGGLTYPDTLASNTPNDGTQLITVPATQSLTARVKVICSDNIFFDISNEDFTILSAGAHILATPGGINSMAQAPSSIVDIPLTIQDLGNADLTWSFTEDAAADCLSPEDVPWLVAFPPNGVTTVGNSSPTIIRFDSTGMAPGVYNASICIASDDVDPADQLQIIPVTMEVVDIACNSYASADVPLVIPATPAGTFTSDLVIPDNGAIYDLNINLVGTHTWVADLIFTLESPIGTRNTLISETCGGDPDFDIILDDESTRLAGSWPCPPVDGLDYQPENPLSTFDGEDLNGTWILEVTDVLDPDGGSVDAWSVDVCTIAPPQVGAQIEVSKASVSSNQVPDTIVYQNFGIYNPGDALLTWDIDEDSNSNCATVEDVPWLSLSPTSGTANGGYGGESIQLVFNSMGMVDGTYTADLCINSDDVDVADQLIVMPVTMNISSNLCTIYSSNNVGLRIPPTGKSGSTVSNLTVAGGTSNISDINLVNLTGTHDRVGHLEFYLDAPSPSTTTLLNDASTDVCGNTPGFDFGIDDAGLAGPVVCSPFGQGNVYQPDGSMATFNGEDSNGTWILTIVDNIAGGGPATRGTGQLDSWGLEICANCIIPSDISGLNITAVGNDANLAWTDVADEDNGYQIWYGVNEPYFDPITLNCIDSLNGPVEYCRVSGNDTPNYTHTNGVGSATDNHFYAVVARNSCGTGSLNVIERVGEFDYAIIPGS